MAQRHDENYNEQPMTRMGRIQQPSRRYRRLRHPSFTAAIWTANNPLLQRGEIGGEIDTHRIKMGDGVTYWNDLPYASDSIATWGDIQGNISDQTDLQDALVAKQDVLTAGTGISIDSDNVISNSGVRSVATGTTNGTISVNTGGTSAEVAVYGLGSAAYTSSSDYATAAQGVKADNAANKDLSNLTSTGANIGNWSSNVSNCITEIPQDIILELNAGILTLKAGSKLRVPNGDGVFDTVTIPSDKTFSYNYDAKQYFVFYSPGGNIDIRDSNLIFSGPTEPALVNNTFWYDTTNNVIKKYHNSQWNSGYSFPVGLITTSTSGIVSIDQVFNGFGYIGSTVFALPGVKYLRANGRNSDGTLKSILSTISSVKTVSASGTYSDLPIILGANAMALLFRTYDEKTNKIGSGEALAIAGKINVSSGSITELSVKTSFHAVDYNDGNFIANCAMPSDRYVDLTLGASGNAYTAPADGYFTIAKGATASGQYVYVRGTSNNEISSLTSASDSLVCRTFLPVFKGQAITITYTADSTTYIFRFVYANGAK